MRAPLHLRENPYRLRKLRRWAALVRARMGAPVYLVGSALVDHNADPRDWDIRVMLPEADFRRLYGDPAEWLNQAVTGIWRRERFRWSDDCVKTSREAWCHVQLNVDFQAYPRSYCRRFRGQPRYRLA